MACFLLRPGNFQNNPAICPSGNSASLWAIASPRDFLTIRILTNRLKGIEKHGRIKKKEKHTPKVTYVFIVRKFTCHALSNHAHVHYPILMIGYEELEGFEKNTWPLKQRDSGYIHIHQFTLQILSKKTFCWDETNIYINAFAHTNYFIMLIFYSVPSTSVTEDRWFSSIKVSCASKLFFHWFHKLTN